MTDAPARSPITSSPMIRGDGAEVSDQGAPAVLELTAWSEADCRAAFEAAAGFALPRGAGEAAERGPVRALAVGPHRWMILCKGAWPFDIGAAEVAVGRFGALVDLTGAYVRLKLSGPRSSHVLARGCSLDQATLAPRRGAQTLAWGVSVLLVAGADGFELLVPRSYALFVWRHLEKALPR